MSTAVLVLPTEELLRDYDLAILMVDAGVTARAIEPAEREQHIAAVLTALSLMRIRRGEKEPR